MGSIFKDGIDYATNLDMINSTIYKTMEEIYEAEGITTDKPFLKLCDAVGLNITQIKEDYVFDPATTDLTCKNKKNQNSHLFRETADSFLAEKHGKYTNLNGVTNIVTAGHQNQASETSALYMYFALDGITAFIEGMGKIELETVISKDKIQFEEDEDAENINWFGQKQNKNRRARY